MRSYNDAPPQQLDKHVKKKINMILVIVHPCRFLYPTKVLISLRMVTTGARQRTTYKQSIREQTSRERNNNCVVDDRQKNKDVAVIVRLVKENQALK